MAIEAAAGGNDPALAKKIAIEHPNETGSKSDSRPCRRTSEHECAFGLALFPGTCHLRSLTLCVLINCAHPPPPNQKLFPTPL